MAGGTAGTQGSKGEHQQQINRAALGREENSPAVPGHESPHPVDDKANAHRGSLLTRSSFLLCLHPEWIHTIKRVSPAMLNSEPVDMERRLCSGRQ